MNHEHANETGAICKGNGKCVFRVWAPEKNKMILHLCDERHIEMEKDNYGYFGAEAENILPGTTYRYMPDGEGEYPDPASFFQPSGVHGPSEVVDHDLFRWNDRQWKGIVFGDMILYEIHTGTFTREGTFDAIIPLLDDLVDTGINAIELMPVGQFSGNRNWGYDGVYPYAVQDSYGGPDGLKRLVDACHRKGIAVFLDVIYNHLGPEGNYFVQYGPYFSSKYHMPWGDALNFDGEWSDGVRDYFSDNAVYWFDKFHIDGLRLDAIHTIYDDGAVSFWELLSGKVSAFEKIAGRPLYLVAESDLNSARVIRSPETGGYGFNAQWLDDFHHALYTMLDDKGRKRYEDYGTLEQLAKAYRDGFVLSGDWVKFRKRKYGSSSAGVAGDRFVVFNQNHDQVGNRVKGERLSMLVDPERTKLAAAAILLSPYVPMLFMGEEYGEDNPFYYFVSHGEEKLISAVREGRKKDFSDFGGGGEFPDPQDEKTFVASVIDWNKRKTGAHRVLLDWHRALIALRKKYNSLRRYDKSDFRVQVIGDQGLVLIRKDLYCLFNFSAIPLRYRWEASGGSLMLYSADARWAPANVASYLLPQTIVSEQELLMAPVSVAVYERPS